MKFSIFKPVSGIYRITNNQTGKLYVGQAGNLSSRLLGHFDGLITGKHSNIELLADFQKYGADEFSVDILERCNKEELLVREKYYIEQYRQAGFELYNINQLGRTRKEPEPEWQIPVIDLRRHRNHGGRRW